jgi:hypothetical protein
MTGLVVDPPTASASNSSDEFGRAWDAFIVALAAVARVRSTTEREFVDLLLGRILEPTRTLIADAAFVAALRTLEESPVERPLLGNLTHEMWFYVWAYRDAHESLPPLVPDYYQVPMRDVRRDPQDEAALDDAETVIGSIEKLIDKLPGPLKRFLHALLEVLKLTRGIT